MSEPKDILPPALRFSQTVRLRVLLIALLPMLIILPTVLGLTVANWSKRFDEVLISKVNGELTIAHQHLSGLMQGRSDAIHALGQSAALARHREAADDAVMADFLAVRRAELGLDFLYLIDANGYVVSSPAVVRQENLADWPVVSAALLGERQVAIDIFAPTDLALFGAELADMARLTLVPTPAAVPTDRSEEGRGMVVHAAAPAPGGALVGGVLLNRNLGFIDEINDLVYPAASLTEGSLGTATLFLEDVRISTNVRMFDGVRALGTRVSAVVRSHVLDEGLIWLDRAFVVNDWYVSAYEPIVDSFGNRVGMLYVGFLEAPFSEARWRTLRQIGFLALVVLVLSVPVLLRWAHGIFVPLEKMNATIGLVEAGDLAARTGGQPRTDEIGRVAQHLDSLLDQIEAHDQSLRELNEELEARVVARTRDLEEANRQLKITTGQLIVTEKLAAIGEITAGVAHEINNPLAVIQGNLDVIYQELGDGAAPLKTEFKLIFEQIHVIHVMVSKLLQFARPEEFVETGIGRDPDQIVHDTLPLVQHLRTPVIDLRLDLNAGGQVQINPAELQQVLVNIIANGIQAMPEGGVLTISSRRHGGDSIAISITDTGGGMTDEVVQKVFDPFFTTKRGIGTGLGLSISSKVIARAGGKITVDSTPGQGTTFTVVLPLMRGEAEV